MGASRKSRFPPLNFFEIVCKITEPEVNHFVFSLPVTNDAYRPDKIRINILYKDGRIADITTASDQAYIAALQATVKKHFLCYPKDVM